MDVSNSPVGGFKCEFVEKPTETFQTECSVCKLILREPYQAICCGKSYCHSCIERVKASNNPACPHCNEKEFNIFHNKGFQQSLYQLKVRCTHQKEGCEWTGELGELDNHVAEDCPLKIVKCDFHYAGCEVKLPRKDMGEHLRVELVKHTSMMATSYHEKIVTYQKEIASYKQQQDQDREKIEELKERVTKLEKEQKEDHTSITILQAKSNFPPVDIIMNNFEQHKESNDAWYSPPFYTHHRGYKLCLRCYAKSIYLKNQVSVLVYLMQGEFDDELKWPLKGEVTIHLISQDGSNKQHTKTLKLDNPKSYSRLTRSDRSIGGQGELGFISHEDCETGGYLRFDRLHFKVFKIILK